ncbi:basic secretory family protein [Actinomadura violacea]|nr:basic secretory family protein [Actinomadura violacea]
MEDGPPQDGPADDEGPRSPGPRRGVPVPADEPSPRSGAVSRRRMLALGAGGAALLAAGGAGVLGARSGGSRAAARTARPTAPFDPQTARDVLANRSRAVAGGDRTAFLATVSSAPAAFQDAQARLYDNLRRLPLDGWTERFAGTESANAEGGAAVVRVETRYRLRGFDRGDVARTRHLAFAPRSGAWTIVGDGSALGRRDDAEIWDAGPLTVVRGRSSLVIGDGGGLQGIAKHLDVAVPVVTGVVGKNWAQRAVALVPADERLAAALAGPDESLGQIAALATVAPSAGGGRGEDRVIVSPGTFGRLNALGRTVVLTHELTHVATGGATDRTTPLWLIEGFADYVGYKHAKVSVKSAASELRREVKAGRVPSALPAAADFAGSSDHLSQAYQEAWLACRMVAGRYGEATLVRLYRAAGRSPEAAALRSVLGLTRDRFVAQWRDYLKKELT